MSVDVETLPNGNHLHTPEARQRAGAARTEKRLSTRRTTRPGSETTDLTPGTPVRIAGTGVSLAYKRRKGWVAVVNAQTFENGLPAYTEIGVTFHIWKDWEKASADAWFRVDEVEATDA